jgi:hypothetical protein
VKQTRPIIHNRDHEHGGADVVRIAWEQLATTTTAAAAEPEQPPPPPPANIETGTGD